MCPSNDAHDATSALISVLLPAYDAEATLEAALQSVQRQTEPRWECVVVDDGSRDRTRKIAERFAAEDPRFRVVAAADSPAEHAGLVAALQSGLGHCHGGLVARMDADDVMHRDRLRAQRVALERTPSLAAVGCHVRLFPRRGLSEGLRRYESWLNRIDSPERVRSEAFVECPVAHPTLMIRREVLLAHGYHDAGWPEDYDLVLRLLGNGHDIGMVPRMLLAWRDHPGRLQRTDPVYKLERFTDCKAFHLAQGLLLRTQHYVLWGYGDTGRSLRRALLKHGKKPCLIVEVHAGRLGQLIHGARVIAPSELGLAQGRPVLASVANDRARAEIRTELGRLGLAELRDYVCCA